MSLEGKSEDEIKALASIAEGLLSNKDTRLPMQRMMKRVNPGLVIPEVDSVERIEAATKPLQERIEKDREERELERQQRAAQELRRNLRDAGSIENDAQFEELVTYAAAHGFQTNEAGLKRAASARAAEQEAAEPTPQSAAHSLLPKGVKDIMKDPARWARETANNAMTELMKGRKRAA